MMQVRIATIYAQIRITHSGGSETEITNDVAHSISVIENVLGLHNSGKLVIDRIEYESREFPGTPASNSGGSGLVLRGMD